MFTVMFEKNAAKIKTSGHALGGLSLEYIIIERTFVSEIDH